MSAPETGRGNWWPMLGLALASTVLLGAACTQTPDAVATPAGSATPTAAAKATATTAAVTPTAPAKAATAAATATATPKAAATAAPTATGGTTAAPIAAPKSGTGGYLGGGSGLWPVAALTALAVLAGAIAIRAARRRA
jgi:hypothetical protein